MPIARFQMPDGKIGRFEVPDGTTEEQAQSLIEEHLSNNEIEEPGQDSGALMAGLDAFNSAVPFGRKITSAMGAGIAKASGVDESFSDLYNQAEANAKATEEAHPIASKVGLGLGIANTLPLGFSNAAQKVGGFIGSRTFDGAGLLAKAGNLAAKSAKSAIVASPSAALYGAGEAESGEEWEGAKSGAGVGAAIGAAIPVADAAILAPAINKLQSTISRKWAQKAYESMLAEKGLNPSAIPDKALAKVVVRLRADFPDEQSFQDALETYAKGDKALVEVAGDRTVNLAKGAAQYPSGEAASKEFIYGKLEGTPQRIKKTIGETVSPNTDYYSTIEDIAKKGQAKAAPKYQEAFSGQPVISDRVNEFVNTPEMQAGIARGMKIQRLEAIAKGEKFDPQQYGITAFNEAGDPIISGVPNMRLLDAGKRGIDAMIQDNTNEFGKVNELGRALVQFKQSYLGELDNINPAYKEAREIAGDYLSNTSAMRSGVDFEKMDAETVARTMSKLSDADKEAFRAGVVKSIRDKIDNSPDNANLYNRVLGKAEQRERLFNLLGEKEYGKLTSSLKDEQRLYKLRDEVLGGSPTSSKQVAREEFEEHMGDLASDVVRKGATRAAIDRAAGFILKRFDGLSDKTARQVAEALYETDPKKKYSLVLKIRATTESKQAKPALEAFFGMKKALPAIEISKEKSIPVIEVTKDRK